MPLPPPSQNRTEELQPALAAPSTCPTTSLPNTKKKKVPENGKRGWKANPHPCTWTHPPKSTVQYRGCPLLSQPKEPSVGVHAHREDKLVIVLPRWGGGGGNDMGVCVGGGGGN